LPPQDTQITLNGEARTGNLLGSHGWQINLMLAFLPFFLGFNPAITSDFLPSALRGWGDFRQLYTGGYMFRVGERQNFYDYNTQVRYEQKLVPIPTHLPVNHLAYEHLLFVPLSLMPYRSAYGIFFAVNVGLAALTLWLLLPSGRNLTLRWKFFVPCLVAAFLPIWRALLQGQDSILLLTLLAAAMFVFDKGRSFEAGLLVGAGLFKFQIVLPIALLFLLWRQWRFVGGFCASSAVAIAISLWMVGLHGTHQYLQMMAGMSLHLKSQADVARYATSPLAMLNLRGLFTGVLGRWLPHIWVQALIGVSSICVLGLATRKIPNSRKITENCGTSSQFSLSVLTASLVSYHFIEHDASILIIPVVVALASLSTWRGAAAVAVFVGMLAGLAPQYGFLGAVPVIILFLTEMGTPFFKNSQSGAAA
jgi:hypothetical protein